MRPGPTLAALIIGACGGGNATPPADAAIDVAVDTMPAQAVAIAFTAEVNGAPFACGQVYDGVGSPGAMFAASDFRMFIHDIALTGPAGATPVMLDQNAWQRDGVALLDFEDGCGQGTPALHAAITGHVAPGAYSGVQFKLGLPAELDHLDASTAAPPLDDTTLWWVWRAGYKYLKVDGASGTNAFSLHLGATGCPGDSSTTPPTGACAHPNVASIAVAIGTLDPGAIAVVADLGRLLAQSNVASNTANTAPGCMSDADDPECGVVFPRLGLPINSTPAGPQLLFSPP